MSKSRKKLERAYKLIKRDKVDDALKILRPVVEAEPENSDAWWMMAYALQEPEEIRAALLRVLEYDQAGKHTDEARELLQKLNSQFPPSTQELMRHPELSAYSSPFPDLITEDDTTPIETLDVFTVDDDPFTTAVDDDFFNLPDEDADAALFASVETSYSLAESDTGTSDDDLSSLFRYGSEADPSSEEAATVAGNIFDPDSLFPSPEAESDEARILTDNQIEQLAMQSGLRPDEMDEDIRARIEEGRPVGKPRNRVRRLLVPLIAVIAIVLLLVVLLLVLGQEDAEADLDQLEPVASESAALNDAVADAQLALEAANLGTDPSAFVADGDLGSILFLQFCTKPVPDLAKRAFQAMEIAVQQAPAIQGELDAVGVSINSCTGDARDVLYRASVRVDDALSYVNGSLGSSDIGRANFQNLWDES